MSICMTTEKRLFWNINATTAIVLFLAEEYHVFSESAGNNLSLPEC